MNATRINAQIQAGEDVTDHVDIVVTSVPIVIEGKSYMVAPEVAEAFKGLSASKGDAKPFMWAIQEPNGKPYFDADSCVFTDSSDAEYELENINDGIEGDPYKVVPVYLHPPESPSKPRDKDGDRYRWLRNNARYERESCRLVWWLPRFLGITPIDKMDEQIDAAIAATQKVAP